MFVWIFHRTSGLLLIVLLGLKMFTGLFMMTKEAKPDWALALHVNALSDILLTILLVFHASYGLRTMVFELGVKNEKILFWLFTGLAAVATVLLVALYLARAA